MQPNRGDFVKLVNEDKMKLDIFETDQDISEMSKDKFKKIIKEKIEAHAIKYLNNIANTHSK